MTTLLRLNRFLAAASLGAFLLGGCEAQPTRLPSPRAVVGGQSAGPILLDGDTSDWAGETPISADEHYLYLRFSPGSVYTLQSAPVMTTVLLDLDGDTATGERSSLVPFNGLGVDLELTFSPRQGAAVKPGVAAATVNASGNRTPIATGDLDFTCTPTYAATWYEMRISRTPENAGLLPRKGLLSSGLIRGIFALRDDNGKVTGYSDPFETEAGAAAPARALARVDMPAKAADVVRVMSWNVEKSGPLKNQEVFRRVFQAAQPDVVLISEWEEGDAESVQGWFTALVGGDLPWNVCKAPGNNASGGGVAVASRYPLVPLLKETVTRPASDGKGAPRPVRFIAATISTPMGDFIAGAMHLKCCGTMNSSEDNTRMAEARAINAAVAAAMKDAPGGATRVIAGDLNLVGSRPPLDLLRASLDADASDLSVVLPVVLGDNTVTTWRDGGQGFAPGRLDYLVYSDATADIANAFVLDTARLSDESLARLGLDRTDSEASDHLPLIVDIRPRR